MSVPDEGFSRNVPCALNLTFMFLLLSLGRYLCWWTISPEAIICPVVSVSALICFSRYIRPFFTCSQILINYSVFQSFDYECTWWSLFQKCVMLTKFDIYTFLLITCLDIIDTYIFSLNIFYLLPSTNKTDRHDITEILLKVALNTITTTLPLTF